MYFVTGHNEYDIYDDFEDSGLGTFKRLLAENNILSRNLVLEAKGEIPEFPMNNFTPRAQQVLSLAKKEAK